MSRTPARITQADVARAIRAAPDSVVYIVRIGKIVKIGFSRNLEKRLKAFQTSAVDIELLISVPGGVDLERRLHQLFCETHIDREMFHNDWRISNFICNVEYGGLERGLQFLEQSTPEARSQKQTEDRRRRIAAARQSKAEKDTYFSSLVAQRKERLGW